ncbi:hypothetical protein [Salinisphaera sp.]|uniref:hypothetical protein n=1 Tax=Salinisphaera sp. TaxID=1914330 RepID=UPI002D78715D|nr:hypothetical protein [Salinisphaera sp.]HET7313197.1 hypothetical protein [Salinisphaera sp.]
MAENGNRIEAFELSGFVLYLLLARVKLSMPGYVVKRVTWLYVPYRAAESKRADRRRYGASGRMG